MTTLYLIRHGQASFGAADYDALSERGVAQSRRLGEYLAKRGVRLHACYAGPRRRQQDTAQHALEAAGGRLGAPVTTLAELDEYPAFELLALGTARAAAEDADLAALLGRGGSVLDYSGVARLIGRVTVQWIRGELGGAGIETFGAFVARVREGIDRAIREAACEAVREAGPRAAVAVFTSGGPIAATIGRALGLGGEALVRVAGVIANASLHELRARDGELTLLSFNNLPHLDEPSLVTYR